MNVRTEYGMVAIGADSVSITATEDDLYAWSHRPCNAWPCSELSRMERIRADFDSGGLVDLIERWNGCEGMVPADEFNAWSSDVLRDVLPTDHPCYFITVGQFPA